MHAAPGFPAMRRNALTILIASGALLFSGPSWAPAQTNPVGPAASRPPAGAPDEAFPLTLASFATTMMGSTPARTANVRLAAMALDGQVVAAGEELSFNLVVGPRTAERGYQDAPVILRETRQLQPGGGVCQVASTLFTAGLLAGLTPIERHRHSSPVDYIALGEDATIAWGAKDLRLRNDHAQPVRIRMEIVGRTLSARVEAAEPTGDAYELETEERELPVTTLDGRGLPGREVELYRVRRAADGTEERELVQRDVYPPSRPPGERRGS
jgi:hypothetical protein